MDGRISPRCKKRKIEEVVKLETIKLDVSAKVRTDSVLFGAYRKF
jgi:hypothetical protein